MQRKILVLGTSQAAKCVREYYSADEVVVLGRRTQREFDLLETTTWPSLEELATFDEVHYTVHSTLGVHQIPAMTELLRHLSMAPIRLIAYTSGWGSITLTADSRWSWLPYKLVKSAMNMTCKVLAHQKETRAQILLFHPGSYGSRMNPGEAAPAQSVMNQALRNLDHWDGQFMFMDGKTGKPLPF